MFLSPGQKSAVQVFLSGVRERAERGDWNKIKNWNNDYSKN